LKAEGLRPDAVLGHSFGEFTASLASNVTTLSQTPDRPTADWRIVNGAFPSGAEAEAMIRTLQTSAPVLEPAPLWQLPLANGLAIVFLSTPVY
jgi:acyl transferase domain-containing protein